MKLSLVELFYLALPESLAPHEPEEAQGVLGTVEVPGNGQELHEVGRNSRHVNSLAARQRIHHRVHPVGAATAIPTPI